MYQLIRNTNFSYSPYMFKADNKARLKAIENNEIFYIKGTKCKHGHDGPRYTKTDKCIECAKNAKLAHRVLSKEKVTITRKKAHLKELYNITPAKYNEMLWQQSGLCAICNNPETVIHFKSNRIKMLSVDHCHKTGKIRGLLCTRCNQGIGLLSHNPSIIRKAALYCEET